MNVRACKDAYLLWLFLYFTFGNMAHILQKDTHLNYRFLSHSFTAFGMAGSSSLYSEWNKFDWAVCSVDAPPRSAFGNTDNHALRAARLALPVEPEERPADAGISVKRQALCGDVSGALERIALKWPFVVPCPEWPVITTVSQRVLSALRFRCMTHCSSNPQRQTLTAFSLSWTNTPSGKMRQCSICGNWIFPPFPVVVVLGLNSKAECVKCSFIFSTTWFEHRIRSMFACLMVITQWSGVGCNFQLVHPAACFLFYACVNVH